VKPAPFLYRRPTDLATALGLLGDDPDGARVLAGGQSLMALMAMRLARPEVVVDINEIAALAGIERDGAVIQIGAAVRQRAVERDPDVRASLPVLADAVALIGHPTIRNRGTVCGSLAHADPASELPAVAVALDADLVVQSTAGTRVVPARDYFVGPFTTSMEPGEMLTHVRFDTSTAPSRAAIVEHARRSGDFAIAGVVCGLDLDETAGVAGASVVAFGVDPFPRRAVAAEQALAARAVTVDAIDEAAGLLADGCDPTSDIHGSASYRRRIVAEMLRRAVGRCLDDVPADRPTGGDR